MKVIICLLLMLGSQQLKAKWELLDNLEYLHVCDSSITLARVNEDCTKLFVYSEKEKITRLYDMESGLIINENKFNYKVQVCEYDFISNRLYFFNSNNNGRDTNLPKLNYYAIWYKDTNGQIGNIRLNIKDTIIQQYGIIKEFNNYAFFKIIDSSLYIGVNYLKNMIGNPKGTTYESEILQLKQSDTVSKTFIRNDYGRLTSVKYFEKGIVSYIESYYYDYTRKDFKSEYNNIYFHSKEGFYVYRLSDATKQVNYNEGLTALDINYGYFNLARSLTNNTYVSMKTGMPIDYNKILPNHKLNYYKLIKSIRYFAYFPDKDVMLIYDNEAKYSIAAFMFKEGTLSFNNQNNIIYSTNGNNIYRLNLSKYLPITNIENDIRKEYSIRNEENVILIKLNKDSFVEIYNILGKRLNTYSGESEFVIQKDKYDKGLYIIQINIEGKIFTEKLFVE